MLSKIVNALAYGVVAALVFILLGIIIAAIGSGPFNDIGHFFIDYAWIVGIVVALLAFVNNWVFPRPW